MAIHPSPHVRDIVYPVLTTVPLLWFLTPSDEAFENSIKTKSNLFSEAFLYTSKLFNEHFALRCIQSMHSLLAASEQGPAFFFLVFFCFWGPCLMMSAIERHVARLLRASLLLNHTDTKNINALLKIAQHLFNHPKATIRALAFAEPWTAFAGLVEHFESQKRLIDIGLRPILNW